MAPARDPWQRGAMVLLPALSLMLLAPVECKTDDREAASGARWVSYWFAPQACDKPPPPPPPAPPGCLPDCSYTPCGACVTGCPDLGTRVPGHDGHGCNHSGGCNRCACNAIPGMRKASTCPTNSSNGGFDLCPTTPVACYPYRNVTTALDFLKRQGGAAIATSMFLYCGDLIDAEQPPISPHISPHLPLSPTWSTPSSRTPLRMKG